MDHVGLHPATEMDMEARIYVCNTVYSIFFFQWDTKRSNTEKQILLEFQSPNSLSLVLQVSPEQWTEELGHPPGSVLHKWTRGVSSLLLLVPSKEFRAGLPSMLPVSLAHVLGGQGGSKDTQQKTVSSWHILFHGNFYLLSWLRSGFSPAKGGPCLFASPALPWSLAQCHKRSLIPSQAHDGSCWHCSIMCALDRAALW